MYKPVDPKVSFPEQEEKVLSFWKEKDIFKKNITITKAYAEEKMNRVNAQKLRA